MKQVIIITIILLMYSFTALAVSSAKNSLEKINVNQTNAMLSEIEEM